MIKNIVFDFGQVLVHFDPHYMVTRYVADPSDAAILEEVLFDRLYWDRLDAGTISDDEVISESKKRLPERLHEVAEQIYYNWIYNIPEIDGMRELLCELKSRGYRLFLLSNISTYFASHEREIPILKLLDGCVYSAMCGYVKPDRRIYEHLTDKFALDPTETLFVDDRAENTEGAKIAGWSAYLFDGDVKRLSDYLLGL